VTSVASWSIRRKLIGLGVASAAVALVLAAVAITTYDQITFRATKLENITAVALIVGHNAAAALAFDDAPSGGKILSGLRAKPSILHASLYREDGRVFATYTRSNVGEAFTPPPVQPDQAVFTSDRLTLFQQIRLDGEAVGAIYIESDLTELRARLAGFITILVIIMLAAASVSLLLSTWLQRRISGPILELGEIARRVSSSKDYTLRAASRTNDEIGHLIDVFNEMLATVESRDQEVQHRRLQLQEELQVRAAVNVELAAARLKADESNAAKSQFLANMSHEIRTPMNGVIGMTELLSDTTLEPEQREYLDMIKVSADSLLGVIEDILDFSKIEAGMLQVDPILIEVAQVFGDAVKAMALRAHQKGLELVYHVSPSVPEWILADPLRLRQVLTNLLGNAIKFTERGEVALDVTAEPLDGGGLTLHIRVRDTGIGIPRDKLDLIFAPFEQADGSTTRNYGGTGLGLTISHRLAALMQGRIWVESEEGRGSTFHFTAHVSAGIGASSQLPEETALAGLRVLVIDDNATNRFVLREMVHRWGMRPTTADGGERALEAIREATIQDDPYHVVLLDCHMPHMDGFMVAERILGTPEVRDVTILMLTSAERSSDVKRCRELGLAAYLVKPVMQKELRATVLKVLAGTPLLVVPRPEVSEPIPDRLLRILLAEDNVVNQKVAVSLLSRLGHEVVVASNGAAAVDAFRQQTFDLILMDVEMPIMSGYDATSRIREIEQTTGMRIPIVAMTARAMKGDRERCLDAGMDDYMSKPIQGSHVMEVIRRSLSPATIGPEGPAPFIDDTAALALVGGDRETLREVKELCIGETPRLLDEIERAAIAAQPDAVSAAAHALRGMYLVFGPNEMVTVAGRLEELAVARDLTAAKAALEELRPAAARVIAALRSTGPILGTTASVAVASTLLGSHEHDER
jgi:two-component system, sensor histidine kinase and response regulator